jgi:hypothetical protein
MGGAAQGGNATNATTAAGVAGGNQSTSEVRMNIEQARMALQNNDTQSAMMYLDMALSSLAGVGAGTQGGDGGNMTHYMPRCYLCDYWRHRRGADH